MGVVYLASDPTIGRRVAIKTIRIGEASEPAERMRLRERLFREARSAGALSHPGIVTIYDIAEQDDLAFIAMEYVNGSTLDPLLCRHEPPTSDKIFSILEQTAAAIDYAHQKGVVHRDLKPANIMIDEQGTVKITDFGIAKVTTNEQFTMTGVIVGTPHYMSPEQVQGLPVDGRSDQFSLAVIAYEMLTGEKPFVGEQLTTVVYKIVAEEPIPPQRLNPTLGPEIEAVLRKGLAKHPNARYATCGEFVGALKEACRATRGWKALPRGAAPNLPTVVAPTRTIAEPIAPLRRDDDSEQEQSHRRWPLIIGAVAVAALLGVLVWQGVSWFSAPPRKAPVEANSVPPATPPPTSTPGGAATQPAEKRPSPMAEPGSSPPQSGADKSPGAGAPSGGAGQPVGVPEREGGADRPGGKLTPIFVPTSPGGAVATIDGREESSCITPCTLEAPPGRHTIVVMQPGYDPQTREIDVTGKPQELPMISLRGTGGTLMLSTTPAGATIYIDGKKWSSVTPAQINLAPGQYTIVVEKDGKRSDPEKLEIRGGATSYLRIPLEN